MKNKITIGIILYKNTKYLKKCLDSLLNQTYENFELFLRDQDDGKFEALAYLENNYPELLSDKRVTVFRGENLWHSGGHNFLISKMSKSSEAYLCASNDMLYEKNCIEELVKNLLENKNFSIAVPKLRVWNFERNTNEPEKTNVIDSCGIGLYSNHHFFDIGQGEKDRAQYDDRKEIFGGSGALFLVKKTALEEIKMRKSDASSEHAFEYFDEMIHYKNDVDLAYRFLWAQQKSLFVPHSIAYHDRQVGGEGYDMEKMSRIQKIIKNNQNKSLWVKESSFFGHLVVLYKNVYKNKFSFFINLKIVGYLLKVTGFLLLTEPKVLLQYIQFWKVVCKNKKLYVKKEQMNKQASTVAITKFFK